MDQKDALKKEIIKRFGTPCVVIDLDVVEANIARAQQLCDAAGIAKWANVDDTLVGNQTFITCV